MPSDAAAPAATAATAPAADCSFAETHWKSAESIGTLAVYEDHLARFPTCAFSTLAAARIEALRNREGRAPPRRRRALEKIETAGRSPAVIFLRECLPRSPRSNA
jgi:hypothetical protein